MDGATDDGFLERVQGCTITNSTPMPDGGVAFYAYGSTNGCDDIKLFPADRHDEQQRNDRRQLAHGAHGGTGACHIQQHPVRAPTTTRWSSPTSTKSYITKVTRDREHGVGAQRRRHSRHDEYIHGRHVGRRPARASTSWG